VYRQATQDPGPVLKKNKVPPYSTPAKLKSAGTTAASFNLDSPNRAESKLALASVAPRGTGYEQAVTSQTLVRTRSERGFCARGFFLRKWLSKGADDFYPYPTNLSYIRGTCGTCTSSLWAIV
jgi:hypothetical protein